VTAERIVALLAQSRSFPDFKYRVLKEADKLPIKNPPVQPPWMEPPYALDTELRPEPAHQKSIHVCQEESVVGNRQCGVEKDR
jgi:hypothetical protein